VVAGGARGNVCALMALYSVAQRSARIGTSAALVPSARVVKLVLEDRPAARGGLESLSEMLEPSRDAADGSLLYGVRPRTRHFCGLSL